MKIVNAKGNSNKPIFMFIGDVPEKSDSEYGMCFTGTLGSLLDSIIRDAGIPRADCYFTTLIKIRPDDVEYKDFYHNAINPSSIIPQEKLNVFNEIEQVNPTVIIPLGTEVFKTLGFNGSVNNCRGSIVTYKNRLCMTTHSPSAILKQWNLRQIAIGDLVKVKDFINSNQVIPTIKVDKISNLESAISLVSDYLPGKLIALDIETAWNSAEILCIGFSVSPYIAYSIDFRCFSIDEKAEFLYELSLLLDRKDTKIVMHNSNFDISILNDNGISCNNLYLDTMHSFHLLYPEMEKSLAFVQSIYTTVPYHKHMNTEDLLVYNGYDTGVTYLITSFIIDELEERNLSSVYFNFIHLLIQPVLTMNRIKINLPLLLSMIDDSKSKLLELQKALNTIVGKSINVNSPKQLIDFIYNTLGLKLGVHKNTDNETLTALRIKYPDFIPVANLIKKIRHIRKLLSSYLNTDIVEGNYIYTTYNISGTRSGRLSSSASLVHNGINIQTPPKEIRQIFIPHDGNIIISGDLSQAELRIVAFLASDAKLINQLDSGNDIFIWIASMVFNIPEAVVNEEQRQLAKRLTHATNYGMGDRAFSLLAEITLTEAKTLKFKYFNAFPCIQNWQNDIVKQVNRTLHLTTVMGRTRYFYDRINSNEVLSYLPQSVASDVCLKGLLSFWEWCKSTGKAMPLIEMHDAIVTECKTEDVNIVSKALIKCMTIPIEFPSGRCIIPVKIKTGFNWSEVS